MEQYTGGPDMLGYEGYTAAGLGPEFYSHPNSEPISKYSMLAGGAGFGMMPTAMSSGKMMYLNHFNNLNTIEEEKHETQTSNYFKEGESERDDSKIQNQSLQQKGSKILSELNNEIKGSPQKNEDESKSSAN